MRPCSVDMLASIHSEGATLAQAWKITRRDGVTLFLTDHDANIHVTGVGTFRANIGFIPVAIITSSTNFSSQHTNLQTALTDDGMTEVDVRRRKWDGAKAIFGLIDWNNPTSFFSYWTGTFGRITLTEKGKAQIEVASAGSDQNNLAGNTYSMTCRNSVGDVLCSVNLETYRADFTVVSVTDDFTFAVSNLNNKEDGFFALGQLLWDTGDNAGETSEVQTSLQLTQTVGLMYPPPNTIKLGDTGHVYPGCDNLIQTCSTKFNNVWNFNGEPFNITPKVPAAPQPSASVTPSGGGGGNGFGGGFLPAS